MTKKKFNKIDTNGFYCNRIAIVSDATISGVINNAPRGIMDDSRYHQLAFLHVASFMIIS